jgi:alpha-D-ribose 1-methylphosphonate 5-triphosphate synthase subunit PhnL
MATKTKKEITNEQTTELLSVLKSRFEKNMKRHKGIEWASVLTKLEVNPEKLWSLHAMELSGGEPDVIDYDKKSDHYIFLRLFR